MNISKFLEKILKDKYSTILFIIILIGFFLRVYNYPLRYSLGEETVRDAVVGIESAREVQLPLTGAFSSLGPFTFGPLYTYQLALAAFVLRLPNAPWIYFTFISVLYIFVIYKIGELLVNKKFGLLLAFIAALSPAQIISATHLTSHNNTNIFAVLTIWIFLKIMKKNISYWWGFLLGISLGFGMNLHYQMTGLFVLVFLLLFYKPKRFFYFITSTAGIFVTFIPLLMFELNNHWFNLRNMLYYIQFGRKAIYVPNRWLFYLRDFWPAFWSDAFGVPVALGYVLILISLLVFVYLFYKKKLTVFFGSLILCFLINFVLLRYYWGPRFFGYLNFLRPFVFIFTAYSFYYIYQFKFAKYIALLLFSSIYFFAYPRIIDGLQKDPFTLSMYQSIFLLEKKYPNDKFSLLGCSNKYRGSYNSQTFSMAFLLDKDKRLSNSGRKIGLISQECLKPKATALSPVIEQTNLQDFSLSSDKYLESIGWKRVNFQSIYELNARWWFKEQP